MSIESDFQQYTNPAGFVSNAPNGATSGNDLLFSGEAAVIRRLLGAWTKQDQAALENAIQEHAQVKPGLYARPGWVTNQEDPDDYHGLCCVSPAIARSILDYGWGHLWYFKTAASCPWYEPMFFHYLPFWAHAHWCAGRKPGWLLRAAWCLSVAFSGSTSDQDPWILSWLLTSQAGDKGWLERWATRRYKKRLAASWGTLGKVFARYFNDPNHPIARYCPVA